MRRAGGLSAPGCFRAAGAWEQSLLRAGMRKPCIARPCATVVAILLGSSAVGCGDDPARSPAPQVGADKSASTRILEAGAALMQERPPIKALNAYLDGFHFYNGRPDLQMEAHHYCSVLDEDVIQCVIYDGNAADARIMGVEYIVSARVFAELPQEEKAFWHSHVHEVKSGQLVAPGLPDAAERELMEKLVGTYGKTWHTWHSDLDKSLPLGVPQLMMGFTADGQADPGMVDERDRRIGIDSARKRADRQDIESPPIDPGADAWQRDLVIQIEDPTGSVHEAGPATGPGQVPGTNTRSGRP
jgi:hypothetical protein